MSRSSFKPGVLSAKGCGDVPQILVRDGLQF